MDKELWLAPEQLRRATDPTLFAFASTQDLADLDHIIGQERAVQAIDFGVEIRSKGYNIYAVGPAGSGRTSTVREFLERRAAERPAPADWCYVYNFADPRSPNALKLPAGQSAALRDMMADMIGHLQGEIPRTFEGQPYEERRRAFVQEMGARQQRLYEGLEAYLNERGFALIRSQAGLAIAPMVEGEVMSAEDYQKLDPETKRKYEAFRPELQEEFEKVMREARDLDRQSKRAIEQIRAEMAGFVVDGLLADLREKFQNCAQVLEHLDAVRQDIVANVERFMPQEEGPQLPFMPRPDRGDDGWLARYAINVLVEGASIEQAPVIIEDNPTYHNLIGSIEHRTEYGTMVTDFTQIRAGALHRANGGYLVVEAKDLLANALSYDGLKRSLRNNEIKIEEMAQFYGLVAAVSLQPEPIPLDVKVVIIGDARLYQLLYSLDEDFRELFKVKAEFAGTMNRSTDALHDLASFVAAMCRQEKLAHFGPDAVARLSEESARLADDQAKLTTRFSALADLVRESAFWAGRDGHALVTAGDVEHAVSDREHRMNYVQERMIESIEEGTILIDTQGEAVGQINGLSVAQLADFMFGIPSRITARTFMGRAAVTSIDREVKLTGPIHDKGNLILSSYLASRFAQHGPLSMSATLVFEQNYGGVEGDSASSTELYALLSSLADVPIKQSLAVTGSVNQAGTVQAIGGVNAKIEGFYDLCRKRGLTGDQGVLIPASNVRHLMLRPDVVQAVRDGQFHVYAVTTIEQGIELLTGLPAGVEDAEGNYPEGSLYAAVKAKLETYAERQKKLGGNGRPENHEKPAEDDANAKDEAPDPGVPEPGVPEPGVPEPGVPEPDVPEPDVPDSGIRDGGAPPSLN
ncbi:MAG: AAA family ATPase [Anaerolineae bacterium]